MLNHKNLNIQMNYIALFSALTLSLSLISCKNNEEEKKDKPPVKVDVMIATNIDFPTSIEVNGNVLSEEMVELHPEISGRITYLNMPDGAEVSAGTLLAKINDAELQAQLEQQKFQLSLASKTEQRLKKLLAINGVNQAEYDVAINQVNSLEASIKILNAQIDKTQIKAPFSGKLGLRLLSLGAYVNPQSLIGTIQQSDKTKIDFAVPESYSSMVKIGEAVTIQTNNKEEKYIAIISAIEPQINIETRNIKVRARLKLGSISPGTFVKVSLDKIEKGIVVPSNAIIPDANSNQLIVVKKGKGVFTNVETGIRTADEIQILSGVNPGDSIVVSGVLFVRPKAPLKIRKVIPQKTENASTSNQTAK